MASSKPEYSTLKFIPRFEHCAKSLSRMTHTQKKLWI
jgi:hypothetical protein